MEQGRTDEWARHYDNLLWTVTAIFLALDGGLLAHCSQPGNFDLMLALGGMWLVLVTVVFAASFRELRQRYEQKQEPQVRNLSKRGRRLYQWWWFLSVFLFLLCGWCLLLIRVRPVQGYVWALAAAVEAFAIVVIGVRFNKPRWNTD